MYAIKETKLTDLEKLEDKFDDIIEDLNEKIVELEDTIDRQSSDISQVENKIKVSAKVKAKHEISDYLMLLFNKPSEHIEDFETLTFKEQEEVLKHISLFEDRIHKLLGVKFKEIISASNFSKSI